MLKKTSKPEIINLTSNDVDGLKNRLSVSELSENDKKIMLSILTTYQWLHNQLQTAKFSIHRLRKLFGFKTERHISPKSNIGDASSLFDADEINSQLQASTSLLALTESPTKKL